MGGLSVYGSDCFFPRSIRSVAFLLLRLDRPGDIPLCRVEPIHHPTSQYGLAYRMAHLQFNTAIERCQVLLAGPFYCVGTAPEYFPCIFQPAHTEQRAIIEW